MVGLFCVSHHLLSYLCEVAQPHVLAQGEHCARVGRVLDIHASRVHLVIEREALVRGDAALGELNISPCRFYIHHFAIIIVEVHHALVGQAKETIDALNLKVRLIEIFNCDIVMQSCPKNCNHHLDW